MKQLRNARTNPRAAIDHGAREQLILNHLSQIRHIAQGLSAKLPLHVDFEDLLSAGTVGLLDAIEKFDVSREVRFRTYAELRIRGAILDSLRDMDWASRSLRRKCRHLQKVTRDLERRLGRTATQNEVCGAMKLSLKEYYDLVRQIQGLKVGGSDEFGFFDRGENSQSRLDHTCSTSAPDPFFAFHRAELRDYLAGAVLALPKKERLVIFLYYFDELPMKAIGRILGLTVSSVSFLHTRALMRLRGRLRTIAGSENN